MRYKEQIINEAENGVESDLQILEALIDIRDILAFQNGIRQNKPAYDRATNN